MASRFAAGRGAIEAIVRIPGSPPTSIDGEGRGEQAGWHSSFASASSHGGRNPKLHGRQRILNLFSTLDAKREAR
jgi:hypothetical protein